MSNVKQAFTFNDSSWQPLAEPQQMANAFTEHVHGVCSNTNHNTDFLKHEAEFESTCSNIFCDP